MPAAPLTTLALAFLLLLNATTSLGETFPPEDGESASDDAPARPRRAPRRAPPPQSEEEAQLAEEQDVLREPAAEEAERSEESSEEEPNLLRPKNRKGKVLRPRRSPQSVDRGDSINSMRNRARARNRRKTDEDVIGRLTLGAGLSSVASAADATETTREEQGLRQNYYVGVQGDFRSFRYVAAHLDVYYGIAPTQEIDFTSTNTTEKRSLQQTGGIGLLQLGYPVDWEGWGFFPHVGLGYGIFRLNQTSEPVNAAIVTPTNNAKATETKFQATGALLEVGIETEPSPGYLLFADYAMSLGASGEVTTVTGIGQVAPITVDASTFSRFRIGGVLPVTNDILMGAQFILRRAAVTIRTQTDPQIETLTQIVGTIAYRF